jgi:hypothetical protein
LDPFEKYDDSELATDRPPDVKIAAQRSSAHDSHEPDEVIPDAWPPEGQQAGLTAVPIVAGMPVIVQGRQAKRGASRIWGDVDSDAMADRVKRDFVKKITNPFFSRCFRERVLDMEQSRVRNAFVATSWKGQRERMARVTGPEQQHRTVGRTTSRSVESMALSAFADWWSAVTPVDPSRFSSPNLSSKGSRGSLFGEGMAFHESRSQRLSRIGRSIIANRRQGEQHG